MAEELLGTIETSRLQQLLGANDAERVEELRADDVLAAFAAVQRHVRHARMIAACRPCDEGRIFVVRMRACVQHAGGSLQSLEHLHQAVRAGVVNRPDLRVSGEDEERCPKSGNNSASHRAQSIWPCAGGPAKAGPCVWGQTPDMTRLKVGDLGPPGQSPADGST